MARKVLVACTDLFFSARILETARQTGAVAVPVREAVADAAAREQPDLVIVDLNADALEPVASIAAVRAALPAVPIVGFVRHEEAERIRAAREAGASEVLARGAFSARLPQLLA